MAGTLCKAEILELLGAGKLIHGGDPERTRGCSYDCGVGEIFFDGQIFRKVPGGQEGVKVPPGGVVALFTRETLDLPANIAGIAFPINAMSSRGLLVLNPGHIDPGFRGQLTVKALNLRKSDLLLRFDEPIFTVIFEKLSHPTEAYVGNSDADARVRDFHQREVETTPRTILDTCDLTKLALGGISKEEIEVALDRRWETQRVQVGEMIGAHWTARWTFALMLLAALGGCIGAAAALWPLVHTSPPTATDSTVDPTGRLPAVTKPSPNEKK